MGANLSVEVSSRASSASRGIRGVVGATFTIPHGCLTLHERIVASSRSSDIGNEAMRSVAPFWRLFWFVTDGDVQGKGWKAKYRFVTP